MKKLKFRERAAIRLTLGVTRFASYCAVTGKKGCCASTSMEGWIASVGSARGPHSCAFLVPARLAPKLRTYGVAMRYSTVTPPDKGGPGSAGLRIPVKARAIVPAQQELAESHHRFDDAEHRLRGLLAQTVELFALWCPQTPGHGFDRCRVFRRPANRSRQEG